MPTIIYFQLVIWITSYSALAVKGPLALLAALIFWTAITMTIHKGTLFVYQLVNIAFIYYFFGGGIIPALSEGVSGDIWGIIGFVAKLAGYGILALLALAALAVAAGRVKLNGDAVDAPPKSRKVTRVYLDVPYAERSDAKWLGARFDGRVKLWYAPPDLEPRAFEELQMRWPITY